MIAIIVFGLLVPIVITHESILKYILSFVPNNLAFIRLSVKNELTSLIHGKGSIYYERISYWTLTEIPIQAS
jgi:hypothetical protein